MRKVYHYSRNHGKPFRGKGKETRELLTLIENYFPREKGTTLGKPFTFSEVKTLFYETFLFQETEEFLDEAPNPRTFKARFLYLWDIGLLARTRQGWKNWEIIKNGAILTISPEGVRARELSLPEQPVTTGQSDEEFLEKVRKAKENIPNIDDPDFFSNLLKRRD